MIRRLSLILALLACGWSGGWARAATYMMNDGQSVSGDIVSVNAQGLIVRISEGVFSKRVAWTNFTQEAMRELAKDARAKPFVEPWIEQDEPEPSAQQKKEVEIKIKEVPHLDRPAAAAGFGALFSSPLTIVLFLLIYGANLYAAFEVSIFRNYPAALVCGVSAVAPIIGPIVFLCLPTHLHTATEEAAPAEQEAVAYDQAVPAEVAAQMAADGPPPPPPEATSGLPPTQTYTRGAYTFNRRFFETKLAQFLRVVPSEADKDMIFQVKSTRGEYVGTRLARVMPNELYLLVTKAGASQEVMIPYAEIQQIQVRHKDAPAR